MTKETIDFIENCIWMLIAIICGFLIYSAYCQTAKRNEKPVIECTQSSTNMVSLTVGKEYIITIKEL